MDVEFLKERARVELRKPFATGRLSREKREQQKRMTGTTLYDEDLMSRLREWRRSWRPSAKSPPM